MFVCSVYMPVCIHTKLDYKRMLSQLVNIRVYPCVSVCTKHGYTNGKPLRGAALVFYKSVCSRVYGVFPNTHGVSH
jgi:hypothetical protein